MTTPDSLYLALIAILLLVDHFVLWRAFLRRFEADPTRARVWLWSGIMIILWTDVAAGVVLWLHEGRAWASLGFIVPHGWRLWAGVGFVLALAANYARTVLKITRAARGKRIKIAGSQVDKFAPHTRSELGWWIALSLTAGFCEEFICRGYLIYVFQPMLGWWGAAALSVVVFAAAHLYQGVKGALGVGIVGAMFTGAVLITGSLLPAIALHALMDIGSGLVACLVFQRMQGAGGTRVVAGVGETA